MMQMVVNFDATPTESNKKMLCMAQQKLNEKLEIEEFC